MVHLPSNDTKTISMEFRTLLVDLLFPLSKYIDFSFPILLKLRLEKKLFEYQESCKFIFFIVITS